MSESKTRLGVSAYAICVFILTLGANGLRNMVGWPGFLGLAAALVVWGVVIFVRERPDRFRWYRLPAPLYWFLGLAILSIAWSQYRVESVLGVLAPAPAGWAVWCGPGGASEGMRAAAEGGDASLDAAREAFAR